MEEIKVRTVIETGLGEFLQSHNYGFHEVSADVSVIKRGELENFFLKKIRVLCTLSVIWVTLQKTKNPSF